MQNQQQSQLENISSYSFPGNHLLMLSLVRQPSDNYKKEYFFFITCAPGETGQNGRTFNFQNKFTMKMEIDKLLSFKNALSMFCTGREALIGNFSLMADSSKSAFGQGGGFKSIFINRNQDKNGNPTIAISFKMGQNAAISYQCSIPQAMAIGEVIAAMCKKALELELARSVNFVKNTQIQANQSQPQQQNNYNQQQNFNQSQSSQTTQNVSDSFANTLQNMGNIDEPPF